MTSLAAGLAARDAATAAALRAHLAPIGVDVRAATEVPAPTDRLSAPVYIQPLHRGRFGGDDRRGRLLVAWLIAAGCAALLPMTAQISILIAR